MKLSDVPVLFINLEKDIERRRLLTKNLTRLNYNYNRINAIYGKNLYDNKYRRYVASLLEVDENQLKPQFWFDRHNFKTMVQDENAILSKVGCYLSHILALKTAILNNFQNVLILEDDVLFLKNSNKSFNLPENTDIFYPGGYFFKQNEAVLNPRQSIIKINTEQFKISAAYSYLIPSNEKIKEIYRVFMSVFLIGPAKDKDDNWRSGLVRLRAQAADFMYVNFYQKYGNSYVSNPVMTCVKKFSSNIQDNRKKYELSSFINKDHKNTYKLI